MLQELTTEYPVYPPQITGNLPSNTPPVEFEESGGDILVSGV